MDEHDKTLDKLLRRPYVVGIKSVLWSAKEPRLTLVTNRLYKRHVVEPDLLFRVCGFDREFFLVEYKNSCARRAKAEKQLEIGAEAVFQLFGGMSYKLFVYKEGGALHKEYFGGSP